MCLLRSADRMTSRPRPETVRGSGGERRRPRLEREPEAAARRGVIGRPVRRTVSESAPREDPPHARERLLNVVLDVVEPAREAPREGDRDRDHREDRERIGVQPRREQRPPAGSDAPRRPMWTRYTHRGRRERAQPRFVARARGRRRGVAALVPVPERGEQAFTGLCPGSHAGDAGEEQGERECARDLHADEQERVVVGAGVGQRLDVQPASMLRGATATRDLATTTRSANVASPLRRSSRATIPIAIIRIRHGLRNAHGPARVAMYADTSRIWAVAQLGRRTRACRRHPS